MSLEVHYELLNDEVLGCYPFHQMSSLYLLFLHTTRSALAKQDGPCVSLQARATRYQAVREIRLCPAEEVNFCKFSYDINRCGISYFYFILVTVFYVTGPFLLFFCVACHLLFEKLYLRNLECLVILCTSSVYVYELQ